MTKLERWLTLVANVSVVAGIVFLAAEMRQNTAAILAQTRDSITEKQMEYLGWRATTPELATAISTANDQGLAAMTVTERSLYSGWVSAQVREWENSFYQYRRGLFTQQEYEARRSHWRIELNEEVFRFWWTAYLRTRFESDFRAEIDRIVADVEQAQ